MNLNINSTVLSKVDHIKYLGVWISGNLSWSKHIDVMCKNARNKLGFMYRLFYQHSSTATLRQLYISCVRSQLEYACPVWDPHHTTAVADLEKVQKFALMLCTKNWSHTVDREMFGVKKFSPLAQVAKILRAKISRAQTARAIFARLIFAASVGGEN